MTQIMNYRSIFSCILFRKTKINIGAYRTTWTLITVDTDVTVINQYWVDNVGQLINYNSFRITHTHTHTHTHWQSACQRDGKSRLPSQSQRKTNISRAARSSEWLHVHFLLLFFTAAVLGSLCTHVTHTLTHTHSSSNQATYLPQPSRLSGRDIKQGRSDKPGLL